MLMNKVDYPVFFPLLSTLTGPSQAIYYSVFALVICKSRFITFHPFSFNVLRSQKINTIVTVTLTLL